MELLKVKPKKAAPKRKKKPRKVKYNITLSESENAQLTRVCKRDGTTPARLIKSVLREYLKERGAKINDEIAENQLNLFKNLKTVQLEIRD